MRIEVQNHTIKCLDHSEYINKLNHIVKLPKTLSEPAQYWKHETIMQQFNTKQITNNCTISSCKIILYSGDCLDAALILKQKDKTPLVLNMASYRCAGGGYKYGCGAQEENLFRRSNLAKVLDPNLYPISMYDGIYNKNVIVIKSSEETGYQLLDNFQTLDFLAFPAYKCRFCNDFEFFFDENGKQWLNHEIRKIIYKKLENIFRIAIIKNHKSIVLSAFGNGAYNNPPWSTAQILKQCIENNRFDTYFEYIVIAILEDFNSKKWQGGNMIHYENEFVIKSLTKEEFSKLVS